MGGGGKGSAVSGGTHLCIRHNCLLREFLCEHKRRKFELLN